MTEWRIVYQDVPYNYTDPATLIVKAESKAAAYALAYDQLTRRGKAVYAGLGLADVLTAEEIALVRSYGVPESTDGKTQIRLVEPYGIKIP